MRPLLWILNSYLIILFTISLFISLLLKQTYIPTKERPIARAISREGARVLPLIKIEKIYENDLFDTYAQKTGKEIALAKLPPLPEIKPPKVTSIPVPPKLEIIPPLPITLKGIMFSADDAQKSTVLIEDETAKEQSYQLGNKVKDAQIVKIARDKVVLLRTNGQQETLFLRKDDNLFLAAKDKWSGIIKKINDHKFEIDLDNFKREIQTFGTFLESLSLINAIKDNASIGVRVGNLAAGSIGILLGLQSRDIIEEINDIPAINPEDRIKIISGLKNMTYGQSLNVKIKRNDKEILNKYIFKKIMPAMVPPFGGKAIPDEKNIKSGLFEQSPEQKRMQQQREFYKLHSKQERDDTISDIRKQLLDNMKRREQNVRVFN